MILGLLIKAKDYFKVAGPHFLVSATEVLKIIQLVLNIKLLAITSMSEVGSEHSWFWGFLKTYKGFLKSKKIP